MAKVVRNKNEDGTVESLESMVRRWKKKCLTEGIVAEIKEREAYIKPSIKRKKKAALAARRRKNFE